MEGDMVSHQETKYEQDKHLQTLVTAGIVNWEPALRVHVPLVLCPIYLFVFQALYSS